MSTPASSCRLVHSRVFKPCFFALATLSTPAISVAPQRLTVYNWATRTNRSVVLSIWNFWIVCVCMRACVLITMSLKTTEPISWLYISQSIAAFAKFTNFSYLRKFQCFPRLARIWKYRPRRTAHRSFIIHHQSLCNSSISSCNLASLNKRPSINCRLEWSGKRRISVIYF